MSMIEQLRARGADKRRRDEGDEGDEDGGDKRPRRIRVTGPGTGQPSLPGGGFKAAVLQRGLERARSDLALARARSDRDHVEEERLRDLIRLLEREIEEHKKEEQEIQQEQRS